MVAQPGKEEAKKHLKFVESEDEDRASDNDSSSESAVSNLDTFIAFDTEKFVEFLDGSHKHANCLCI